MKLILSALILIFSLNSLAKTDERGLLPEIKSNTNNELQNEKNTINSEILITKTETKAIDSLQSILKRKKGSPEEPDLWYRLAELYQRRSKTGRFFDLYFNEKTKQLSSVPISAGKSSEWTKKAIAIYFKIETQFKNYREMDSVFFNNAFAHQQIGLLKQAETLYIKLIETQPKSTLMPDAILALSELLYDQGRFSTALTYFEKLENYKESRVYSYGLYKMAWAHYNLRNSQKAIKKLEDVLKLNPPLQPGESFTKGHYLRKEALRDMTIFIGDTSSASELYSYFNKITEGEELGNSMIDLAKLYESHSRHKDMNIFLTEFISKREDNPGIVKAHLMLVDANEALKSRDEVVRHLQTASDLCKAGSSWRLKQNNETALGESCTKEFRQTSLEIAAKWWEIWLKNKQHVAFSELTEKAFRVILDNEDIEKPDLKTRYALAELLFQLNKFEEASDQYKTVGDKSTDPVLSHDATYGALYAKEKSYDKEKNAIKEAQRKSLALNYIKKFPKGQSVLPVSFKVGLIFYEEKNYAEALQWLTPIAENKTNKDLMVKSEDLILDISNIKKDYVGLKNLTQNFLKKNPDEKRKKNLNKINEEAHYSEIQDFSKTASPLEASEKLIEFFKTHPESNLSQTAQWQALSLLYAQGRTIKASELVLDYVEKYPKDEKNLEALKEAAKAFAESGRLLRAAALLASLAEKDPKNRTQYLESSADFYSLENKPVESRKIFNSLLTQADKKDRARIFSKILNTFNGKTEEPEYQKVETTILSQNIEPYSTQILTKKANQFLKQKKFKDAFELARKILSRDSKSEDRAPARLVQAEVLEQELISQSVKSNKEDRLALVLSMKTEKLDKAQTAYLSATKMNSEAKIQLLAYQGIDRCYQNYIASLKSILPPSTLSVEEQKALLDELAKIVGPIEEKRNDNLRQIQAIAKNALSKENQIVWSELAVESTARPTIKYPEAQSLQSFLPLGFINAKENWKKIDFKTKSICDLKKWKNNDKENNTPQMAESCYATQDFKSLEKLALEMTTNKEQRIYGLYLLSYISEAQGLDLKSYWLIEKFLKEQPSNAPAIYQKARLTYKLDGLGSSLPLFSQVLNSSMTSTEIETFRGIKAYTENNYESVIQIFGGFPKDQLYNMNVGLLLSEAYAQKGDIAKSLKVVADFLSYKGTDGLLGFIHQAHLLEMYKNSAIEALDSYQKAFKLAKEEDMRFWIGKKIEYLKTLNKKVGLNANSEVKQ